MHADETKWLPDDKRSLFVKTKFQPIYKTRDLPSSIREVLGLTDNPDSMANPGEDWGAGCVGGSRLPHQRLILAAVTNELCIVYFERGGIARFVVLQLYELSGAKAKLVHQVMTATQYDSVDEIQAALKAKEIK